MNGAALAPLNNRQKARICILAQQAFHKTAQPEASPYLFKNWRHREQIKAVGKEHLTDCRNADYLPLKAHFQDLAGDPVAAFRNHLRAAMEPRAWALAKLRKECFLAADVFLTEKNAWNYASGFLQNKRGLSIEDCSERDLWHAVFLVRRRAVQLRKKGRGQTVGPHSMRVSEPPCYGGLQIEKEN